MPHLDRTIERSAIIIHNNGKEIRPLDLFGHPHRRYNILTGDWILVSPHRTARPWKGKTDRVAIPQREPYDPGCYLCPGNARANGEINPRYTETFSFTNDYSALYRETPMCSINRDDMLIAESESGICKVICYTPRHDLYLPFMEIGAIEKIILLWRHEFDELKKERNIRYVQIFENKGERMGCSNPHPHGQIWASETIPPIPAMEGERQNAYFLDTGRCLLCDYLDMERSSGERIVFENDGFTVLVPFWATWPYETMIIPRMHCAGISGLDGRLIGFLADALKRLAIRYDNLFETEFPYSMGIHQEPTDGIAHKEWHFHFHFYPPLLRSASVAKYMVGYELLAMPQRDITPESAALTLQSLSDAHYSLASGEAR